MRFADLDAVTVDGYGTLLTLLDPVPRLVGSLADYMIPVATDYPQLEAISLELHPSPNNPLRP